jgi:hypothetical protein
VAGVLKNREEDRILLPNSSWETYERLLAEREERRSPRFFYDRGVIEISSPSAGYNMTSRIIATLVELLAEEANIDIENAGSPRVEAHGTRSGPGASITTKSYGYSYWTASTMLLRAAERAGRRPAKTPMKRPESRAARAGSLG